MQTFQHNEKWLIVIHARVISGDQVLEASSPGQTTHTFDMCWSGERWVPHAGLGKQFETQEEALQYLQENAARMEATRQSVPPVADMQSVVKGS